MAKNEQTKDLAGPSIVTIKRLFAYSGNKCAFPKCSVPIAIGTKVVGEICHIKARSEGGPRYDPLQTPEERHGYGNLILLCGTHHTVIDNDTEAYTVERILKMKSEHEKTVTALPSDLVEQGAQLLLDQSVSTTHQSGGITAHSVIIQNYQEAPTPLGPASGRTGVRESMANTLHPAPNLIFVAAGSAPISEEGSDVWTREMGRHEWNWAIQNGQLALLAQFTNEARRGLQNVGGLIKAQLIYRDAGRELRRIAGCWLDAPTDYAEFRVDTSHELLIAVKRGEQAQTVEKRRFSDGFNSEMIETKLESLPPARELTVVVRLTNADTGDFLFEQEFRLTLDPLELKPMELLEQGNA